MRKIVVLAGSPRKNANTDRLVDSFVKGVGYIKVGTKRLGTKGQYVRLVTFQVSEPFRGMGVGRKLFEKASGVALERVLDQKIVSMI